MCVCVCGSRAWCFGKISVAASCKETVGGGTSLVAQWLRIRLPMQGTRARSLVQEDPTCCGATKPVRLLSLHSRAREPQLLSPHATTTEARTPRARAL